MPQSRPAMCIELDVPNRSLSLLVPVDQIEKRLAERKTSPAHFERGYGRLFIENVLQANEGCDFGFLRKSKAPPS